MTLIERSFPAHPPDRREEEEWEDRVKREGKYGKSVGFHLKEGADDDWDDDDEYVDESAISQRLDHYSNSIDYIDAHIEGCMKASRDLSPVAPELLDTAQYGQAADDKVSEILRNRDLGCERVNVFFSFIDKVARALLGNGYSHGTPFGSRVSGYHLPTSDYDLCLFFNRGKMPMSTETAMKRIASCLKGAWPLNKHLSALHPNKFYNNTVTFKYRKAWVDITYGWAAAEEGEVHNHHQSLYSKGLESAARRLEPAQLRGCLFFVLGDKEEPGAQNKQQIWLSSDCENV